MNETELIVPKNWLQNVAEGEKFHQQLLIDIHDSLEFQLSSSTEKQLQLAEHVDARYERGVVEDLFGIYTSILAQPKKYIHEKSGIGFMSERAAVIYKNGLPDPIAAKLVPKKNSPIEFIDCIAKGKATQKYLGNTYTAQRIHNTSTLAKKFLESKYDQRTQSYESNEPAIKKIYHVF